MNGLFDGLGTFLVGLLLGVSGGGAVAYRVGVRNTRQTQRAGDNSSQTQVGRDQRRDTKG